ncbi:oligosaccharide flippase family protein [Catenovulum sp. 2E275]|uniref:oligosaccharide flippase family protein n=1 Tax=Catenovulum sp. 2E275 TaxID=2980497 RepID=UPI0021D095DF|nr:oligosaccharide flippase family protein [Catenovulum sp. 2E275]MCU4674819.1 oligosaccharide flippase family protein [Catenovulum sp. 2E275]
MSKLNKELNRAIIHSLTGKYSLYIFQILSLAVLSRIFTPEMFGALAAVQMLVMFFQLVSNSGLAPAVVYQDKIDRDIRDGLFSFTFLFACGLTLIFLLFGSGLLNWLGLAEYETLVYVLAVSVFSSALSMLPAACLQKDAKFLAMAQAEIFAELVAFSVCIAMYYADFGFIALAMKFALTPLFRLIFYYLKAGNTTLGRPKFGKQIGAIKLFFDFAKFQFLFQLVNFFSRNLDTLLITKYFGAATIGFYEKSYQVMRYPLQLFTFAITPALQPVLTKYKGQPELVETAYYRVIYKLALLGCAVAFVLFWAADDVVFIMFGAQWHQTAPILSLLAVSIPLQMVLSSTGGVYQAFGFTKQQLWCGLFSAATNVTAISLGVYWHDLELLCLLLVSAFIINYLQCFILLQFMVFKTGLHFRFWLISLLILLPYCNLLIHWRVEQNAETMLSALYQSSVISAASFALVALIYFATKGLMESHTKLKSS